MNLDFKKFTSILYSFLEVLFFTLGVDSEITRLEFVASVLPEAKILGNVVVGVEVHHPLQDLTTGIHCRDKAPREIEVWDMWRRVGGFEEGIAGKENMRREERGRESHKEKEDLRMRRYIVERI